MLETVSVSFSGAAFSLFMYETTKATYHQEGFLVGEVIEKSNRTITDNDQYQETVTKTIKVSSAVPFRKTCGFYNNVGKVDVRKLKEFLGATSSKVVGWYKHKPSSSFSLTLREQIIHRELLKFSSVPDDLFALCLVITESSENGATHSYTQNFIRLKDSIAERLPVHIENLSNPNNVYRTPEPISQSFRTILDKCKVSTADSHLSGLETIKRIHGGLQEHAVQLVEKLSQGEKTLFELEQEVRALEEAKARSIIESESGRGDGGNVIVVPDDEVVKVHKVVLRSQNANRNAKNKSLQKSGEEP